MHEVLLCGSIPAGSSIVGLTDLLRPLSTSFLASTAIAMVLVLFIEGDSVGKAQKKGPVASGAGHVLEVEPEQSLFGRPFPKGWERHALTPWVPLGSF